MKRLLSLSFLFCVHSLHGGTLDPTPNFFQMMGKGTTSWRKVRTKEDKQNLELFRESFERNYQGDSETDKPSIIPKKIHLIWLGPKDYPEVSQGYLKSFVYHHPDWEIKLWTDRERPLIDPRVENKIVDSEYLGAFADLYDESDNYGEKSDLLRLVILQNEGGLYVDHDVYCKRPFTPLHQNYPFYTGLQNLGNHVITLSTVVRNSIIGSVPNHPILTFSLGLIRDKWKTAALQYPGKDVASTMARVTMRSFAAFHEAILTSIQDPNFDGIVFPAGYFNELHGKYGYYSHEDMAGSWYRDEITFHEMVLKERIKKLMKRLNMITIVSLILFSLNFTLLALLFFMKLRHAR